MAKEPPSRNNLSLTALEKPTAIMKQKISAVLLLALLSATPAWSAQGDYEPAYDQGNGYGGGTLDERVAKLERKLSGDSQMELVNHVEQLQIDLLKLHGELETMAHQLESLKKQQKDMYQEWEQKQQTNAPAAPGQPPQATEAADAQGDENATPPAATPPPPAQPAAPPAPATPAAVVPVTPAVKPAATPPIQPQPAPQTITAPAKPVPPPTPPTPAPATPSRPAAATTSADSPARQDAYLKGLNSFKESNYADAIKSFKAFLNTYPKGEYADSAAYWLAESQYLARDLPAAREAFRRVVKEFPQTPRVADAQLKLGYIEYDSGQWANARAALGEVVKLYPADSSQVKLAQKRLDKMKQEGH